jgi:cysteine desulfurase
MALKNVAASSGSACTSANLEPSYVLKALGVPDRLAHGSLRFGLGRFTTAEEVDFVIQEVVQAVRQLRALSPEYEMAHSRLAPL